jgi:hypothetical protein
MSDFSKELVKGFFLSKSGNGTTGGGWFTPLDRARILQNQWVMGLELPHGAIESYAAKRAAKAELRAQEERANAKGLPHAAAIEEWVAAPTDAWAAWCHKVASGEIVISREEIGWVPEKRREHPDDTLDRVCSR